MKIVTIVGARPQFIKATMVSRALARRNIEEVLVHTGQHYDSNMSHVFFDELGVPEPKHNLGVSGGNHGNQTGNMLARIEEVFLIEKPDWVLVYGDTNSTLAGALAAAKLHIKVAHIEAGLRSFNKKMPEEINRILTDHISDLLFTPTSAAIQNLKNEGIDVAKIYSVGDVMFDATLFFSQKAESNVTILNDLNLEKGNYILATIHRAENTNDLDRFRGIISSLEELGKKETIIIPLHPRTYNLLEGLQYNFAESTIKFIAPVGYLDMICLQKNSKLIITDSGGVQKEAYFNKIPCITLRDETEWIELVEIGWNFLANSDNLIETYKTVQNLTFNELKPIYGEGKTSEDIVEILLNYEQNQSA